MITTKFTKNAKFTQKIYFFALFVNFAAKRRKILEVLAWKRKKTNRVSRKS